MTGVVVLFVAIRFLPGLIGGSSPPDASRWLFAGLLCIAFFYDNGQRYEDYRLPYNVGIAEISPAEVVFYAWYLLFGTAAAVLLGIGLRKTRLPDLLVAQWTRACARPAAFHAALAALLLALVLAVQRWVLQYGAVADDEATYSFIARTLARGRLTNPSPGDVAFFQNQFIVLNQDVWFGKYPIGFPLLLAAGELVSARWLVNPLLSLAAWVVTGAVARRVIGPRGALLTGVLLAASPQFVATAGTELSQPASTLCMIAALYALLRWSESGSAGWLAACGAALGYGVLVRPLPGVLFAAVATAYLMLAPGTVRVRLARLFPFGAAFGVFVAAFLAVNARQTGAILTTGYHLVHGSRLGSLSGGFGLLGPSLGGALLRQNAWLFGWPTSFLLLPFAGRDRRTGLLWAFVIAGYAYRLIAPKTVVGTTGPIYVAELTPLLAILSAGGVLRLARHARSIAGGSARDLATGLLALFVVTLGCFVPVQCREIRRSTGAWLTAIRMVEDSREGQKALVFSEEIVDVERDQSWALMPPNPSPDLSDDIIFVRRYVTLRALGREETRRRLRSWERVKERDARLAFEFWRRRFPDRRAFLFRYVDHQPTLSRVQKPEDLLVD